MRTLFPNKPEIQVRYRRTLPMSPAALAKELATAERYLKDARGEAAEHHPAHDLIGRALADQVTRMERILEQVRKGIPFDTIQNQ